MRTWSANSIRAWSYCMDVPGWPGISKYWCQMVLAGQGLNKTGLFLSIHQSYKENKKKCSESFLYLLNLFMQFFPSPKTSLSTDNRGEKKTDKLSKLGNTHKKMLLFIVNVFFTLLYKIAYQYSRRYGR